ncbi:MAG TPA: tripartite tricarboxylate transporter substrate binding protein [Acidiferrobacterales bacterium]|nr:tripartite tricarboxylate transporter substrate binding protein [Acidiferrobacterales bacterium]
MKFILRFTGLAFFAALLVGIAAGALAQNYPTSPIRFIVPFPAGGSTDALVRTISEKLSENLGQPVVIDNRPGAGGTIGSGIAAKAAPDGYTLLMGTSSTHAVGPSVYSKIPYDAVRDFAPVSLVASSPNIVLVSPSLPVKSIKELIALAQSKPGQLNFASPGNGTHTHLITEMFNSMVGVKMVHIPYKGTALALPDLLSGQVSLIFENALAALPSVKSGQLRPLAVTSAKRSSLVPDLPTVAEAGVPGYAFTQWFGILVPAGTPKKIIARLNAETIKVLNIPEVKERLLNLGAEVIGSTPDEFAAVIKADMAKYAKAVKEAGIRVD